MRTKEEGKYQIGKFMFVLISIIVIITLPMDISSEGDLPYYDIEQDSLGNYHKAYINDSTGNFEVYYTNDIGGSFPQDWNPPKRISNTDTDSLLLDLGIYLPSDMMFIIWSEENLTYYSLSGDYGENWTGANRSHEKILLKYAEFDPLSGEPDIPSNLKVDESKGPYEYYIVQFKTPTIKDWKDGIEAVGGIFCGSLQKHAFIVWMNDSIKDETEQLPYIRWVGYYHPAYKIQSGLLENDGIIELNVVVTEQTGGQENLDKVISIIESFGGYILYNGSASYIIQTRINAEKIDDISFIPEVNWIDRVGKLWPRHPTTLHHISIISEGVISLNISEAHNFTSVGWDDELEDDLNRSWKPVWGVEGGIGKIIGDGFTITFKATKPGEGKIICTDESTGYAAYIEIQVVGEVEEQESPWMMVLLIGSFIIIAVLLVIIVFRKKKKPGRK